MLMYSHAHTDDGTVYVWGQLAHENMKDHEGSPRLIESLFSRGTFVARAESGALHFCFVVDDRLTAIVQHFIGCVFVSP